MVDTNAVQYTGLAINNHYATPQKLEGFIVFIKTFYYLCLKF